jgi:hypothetical protein
MREMRKAVSTKVGSLLDLGFPTIKSSGFNVDTFNSAQSEEC